MSIVDVFRLITESATNKINRLLKGNMTETYQLNSAEVVDVQKARNIYQNVENGYKLSAGMVRPIINADVSFIGEPRFFSEDDTTNEELKEINKKFVGFYQSAHMVALREGDIYIWVQWDDSAKDVRWVGLPGDKLAEIIRDPVTNEPIQYVFKWIVNYKDRLLSSKTMNVEILVDEEAITYKYTGAVPPGYETGAVRNILGELPIVQLSNEREDFEVKGHSEITAIEPYLKAYHDVMMMALQAQKNNSAPKMKIKAKSVSAFIDNNWGAGTYAKLKDGTQPEGVSVENLDLVLLQDGDDAEYLTVTSTTGSAEPLLQMLFKLIVETSETIEVVFGANLGTSLASVESQLPVYVKKVERKQRQFEKDWEKIVELSLKLKGFTEISAFEGDIRTEWGVVDFETAREKALTLQRVVSSYANSIRYNILSFKEVHEESKKIFKHVIKDFPEHLNEVKDTAMLVQRFLEDSESQGLEAEGEDDVDA